jgi:hypothetical protein
MAVNAPMTAGPAPIGLGDGVFIGGNVGAAQSDDSSPTLSQDYSNANTQGSNDPRAQAQICQID